MVGGLKLVFNPEAKALLSAAGWIPGRNVGGKLPLPTDVIYPAHIKSILNEFGGLYVTSKGPGITVGRNSIHFDPTDAQGESEEEGSLTHYSQLLGTTLYSLGYIPDESCMICIDSKEQVYLVGLYLIFKGNSFAEGISNILLGVDGKTLNEDTLEWY
jgi:hypothetical protein